MSKSTDWQVREKALNPARSFIVQAPAGSGKTRLLIHRFLVLLSQVDEPEEVLAITFTRKAAAEMRQRVTGVLESCVAGEQGSEIPTELKKAGERVLAQDYRQGWGLLSQPHRLRMQTIDSFCATLVRQMPWSSRLAGVMNTTEQATHHYREAARATLTHLTQSTEEARWSRAVSDVLLHLEGDTAKYIDMLSIMLLKRDQWLRHVSGGDEQLKFSLEHAWREETEKTLRTASTLFPSELRQYALACAIFAAGNLRSRESLDRTVESIPAFESTSKFPVASVDDLGLWMGIAELLLTGDNVWRADVNARQGFPSGKKEPEPTMKETMLSILESIKNNEPLRQALIVVKRLPIAEFQPQQWQVLDALLTLLPLAVAELHLQFRRFGETDFSEVTQGAIQALGSEQTPTDLALALDYRIKHLLIDEFQDTSFSQLTLIKLLTAGWQANDGRTFFAVGDPMQSIYRFREAEVGIFLNVARSGIGQLKPKLLQLRINFRSTRSTIEWFNKQFPRVMPGCADINTGAVPYVAADWARDYESDDREDEDTVGFYPVFDDDGKREAEEVVSIIRRTQASYPNQSIAVLVRARGHLTRLLPALRDADISYDAVEIEDLANKPVVLDLLALTRALCHPADRVAWLAILRAPWCGVGLVELSLLFEADKNTLVRDIISNDDLLQNCPRAIQIRLKKVSQILETAIAQRRRLPIRQLVESVWWQLGGPATVATHDLDNAQTFFSTLEQFDQGAVINDFAALIGALSDLKAVVREVSGKNVQIMTMHKAKGLEFDTVILPGLGRKPASGQKQLLHWAEQQENGSTSLLLAPIAESVQDKERMVSYLRQLENEKLSLEAGRVLYVAATRSKRRLHLLANIKTNKQGELTPPVKSSLLKFLWPALEYQSQQAFRSQVQHEQNAGMESIVAGVTTKRLPLEWRLPELPSDIVTPNKPNSVSRMDSAVIFDWAGRDARQTGVVMHRLLQTVYSIEQLDEVFIKTTEARARKHFSELGVARNAVTPLLKQVIKGFENIRDDTRGKWLFDPAHIDVRSEWPLSGVVDGDIVNVQLDRSFVDKNDVRWIVDFKMSYHKGGDLDAFLDAEKLRYRDQLLRYAQILSPWESRDIMLGLYFPLLKGWREFRFDGND